MRSTLNHILQKFESISLNEMAHVSLMKRTDTKFVIHFNDLLAVLENVQTHYRVLEINNKRILKYSSLYFDTVNNKFYNDHHNRKVNRIKIRMRKYLDSGICFLEVKQKDGKGKTTKSRIQIQDFEPQLSEQSIEFIEKTTKKHLNLKPSLWNRFNRITLVNKTSKERLTIDTKLSYKIENELKSFNNLVIVEVKQERFDRSSKFVQELKSQHINPYKISKYCIGMISIYNHLKYNRFKRKIIKINKIAS